MQKRAKTLTSQQKDYLAQAIIEQYERDPISVEKSFPEVVRILQNSTRRIMRQRSENRSTLTELEKGKRLQSLCKLLEEMKDTKGFSREQAIQALEDAAALVEAFPFDPISISDAQICKLVKIATGLSVTTKGRRQTSVLKEGEPSREVYLLRGVKLSLSWDKKLMSVEIDPKQMAIQARALSIIGIGRGMPPDMAERHDDYLVEAYSER